MSSWEVWHCLSIGSIHPHLQLACSRERSLYDWVEQLLGRRSREHLRYYQMSWWNSLWRRSCGCWQKCWWKWSRVHLQWREWSNWWMCRMWCLCIHNNLPLLLLHFVMMCSEWMCSYSDTTTVDFRESQRSWWHRHWCWQSSRWTEWMRHYRERVSDSR